MRKIISKEESEEKSRRNKIIVSVVLVLIMALSTAGYGFLQNPTEKSKNIIVNEFKFEEQNEVWVSNINGNNFAFIKNPEEITNETKNLKVDLKKLDSYSGKPLYLDSEDSQAEIEIYKNLEQISERIQSACFNGEECTGNFPIKNCTENLIIIREANIKNISQNGSCVFIYGNNESLSEVTDEFLFRILGVR